VKSTTIPAPTYICQPWCSDHANCTPPGLPADPADQMCRHIVTGPAFGEFLITHDQRDGLMLRLYNTNLELADRDALEFISAVTAALAQARTAVAR
jgi:hypothetical protein